jgi:Ribbon-helix-helix protein, copG family
MGLRIELPEDLVHDLEQEAARQHVSLAEIIREALHMWKVGHETSESDRERVIQVLRDSGLLCQFPSACANAFESFLLDCRQGVEGSIGPLYSVLSQFH